jgi:hypothetical protein
MNFYICFDIKNGDIIKVSNELDQNLANLEIDKDTYVKFMQGSYSITDYFISIQVKNDKKFVLTKKEFLKGQDYSNYSIKKFAKTQTLNEKNIFYIIQDKKNISWKGFASLDDDYRTFLANSVNYFGLVKTFYITKNNNPNALLGKIVVPVKDFLQNKEFTIEDNDSILEKLEDLAIYANVSHEKYLHVLRE